MVDKVTVGQQFQPLQIRNIHGRPVLIPDTKQTTHLQFRRFAGCPICNTHLQSIRARHGEIATAGIREVVVFHSTDEELLPYQGNFPFEVIGDPEKQLYRRYGVEASRAALLSLTAWIAAIKGNLTKDKPQSSGTPNGGVNGLPADFLITPDGTVKAVHYGTHAYDQWSVDELLNLARQ